MTLTWIRSEIFQAIRCYLVSRSLLIVDRRHKFSHVKASCNQLWTFFPSWEEPQHIFRSQQGGLVKITQGTQYRSNRRDAWVTFTSKLQPTVAAFNDRFGFNFWQLRGNYKVIKLDHSGSFFREISWYNYTLNNVLFYFKSHFKRAWTIIIT